MPTLKRLFTTDSHGSLRQDSRHLHVSGVLGCSRGKRHEHRFHPRHAVGADGATMRQTIIIAVKEFRDGLRNRWVVAITSLLAVFSLALAFLGAAPIGAVNASPLAVTIVSLSSLTIFLLPLVALLLSYDAIVGEIDRGTMALLLAYPVARWQVVLGKFLGHCAILAFATSVGYGAAAGALAFAG